MKKTIIYALSVLFAVAGSLASICLSTPGQGHRYGTAVIGLLHPGESAMPTVTGNPPTMQHAPGNSTIMQHTPAAIVASGDVSSLLLGDITSGSTTASVYNTADLQIPLIFFRNAPGAVNSLPGATGTPDRNPRQEDTGNVNSVYGCRGSWNPVQGTLSLQDAPSLLTSSAGADYHFYDLLRSTYWDGSDRIAYLRQLDVNDAEWHPGADLYFHLTPVPLNFSMAETDYDPGILFCTRGGTAYVAFPMQNKLGLLAERDGKTVQETFSVEASSSNNQGLYPLLLSCNSQCPLLLTAVPDSAGKNRDRLCLIKIGSNGASYIPVQDDFDKYLTGQPANMAISFVAGAGVRSAVCGQRIYIGDICGEDTWSFGLNDAAPALSYEKEINRQTKPWIQTHPSEGLHVPVFYSYASTLIVAVGANNAEGLWAFRDGKLQGRMSIAYNQGQGQIQVYAGSDPGRVSSTKTLPGLVAVMAPSAESSFN